MLMTWWAISRYKRRCLPHRPFKLCSGLIPLSYTKKKGASSSRPNETPQRKSLCFSTQSWRLKILIKMQCSSSCPISKDQPLQESNEAKSSTWQAEQSTRLPGVKASLRTAPSSQALLNWRWNAFWCRCVTHNNIILFLEAISITGPVYYHIIFSIAAINTLNSPCLLPFLLLLTVGWKGKLWRMGSLYRLPGGTSRSTQSPTGQPGWWPGVWLSQGPEETNKQKTKKNIGGCDIQANHCQGCHQVYILLVVSLT